jgi:hypothetical protein
VRYFDTRTGQEKMEPVLTKKHGTDLLNDPLRNKGTAWPFEVSWAYNVNLMLL